MAWTTPRTWVDGETETAAIFNTHIRDNFKAIGDAWTSYTPSVYNITLGTGGTAAGRYALAGKSLLGGSVVITLGTSGVLTGNGGFSLPVAPLSPYESMPLGTVTLFDTSASATVLGVARWTTSGTVNGGAGGVVFSWNNATPTASTNATATTPWTWAVGDRLSVELVTYETA